MGCSSCSKRRKLHLKQFDAPLLDSNGKKISDSFLAYSQKKSPRKKTINRNAPAIAGGTIELDQLRNIEVLPRIPGRINILKHSEKEMAVYIIGHFKGCSACRYMHKLIDKSITPTIKSNVSFYSIEKNDVQSNGFEFKNNPTIVFINNGKPVRQLAGIYPDIEKIIVGFSNKIEKKSIKKTIDNNDTHLVVKLKPNPTHVDAYENLLNELGSKKNKIKNITTFLDQKSDLLVVTIDFK